MSLIWPIPPLPMLCWCFTGITFTYSSYSSLPDTCPAPTSSYVQSYIPTFPCSHIPTYSHIHILSYSPMFPDILTPSLTGTCPVLIIFSQAPVPSSARQTVSTRKEPVAATRDGRAPSAPFDIMSARLVFLTALCIVHSM